MEENLYKTNHIRTFSGKYLDVFNPDPDMICIEDIAHALSNICRFGGHTRHFYSVAQHSVRCCNHFFSIRFSLQALLHDASEAYLLDIPRPIKHRLTNYKETEEQLMTVISQKFGFEWPMNIDVKEEDEIELGLEWNGVMTGSPLPEWAVWEGCWKPKKAERIFLEVYNSIIY